MIGQTMKLLRSELMLEPYADCLELEVRAPPPHSYLPLRASGTAPTISSDAEYYSVAVGVTGVPA